MPKLRREQVAGMGIHHVYYPFEYFLQCQQELGYKTIEYWLGKPHFLLDDYGYQDVKEVKQKIADHGLRVGAVMPECASYRYFICAHDEIAQQHSLGYFTNAIKAAGELGAPVLVTSTTGGNWREDPACTFDRAVATLRKLAVVAADNNVTLAIESLPPTESKIVNTLPELQRLLAAVDHPQVKAALNLTAVGMAGETVKQWFEALGKDLCHLHFQDGRPCGYLAWGDGLHPLPDYIQVLNDYNYEGCLGMKILDRRYYDDPKQADEKTMQAFAPFLI